MNIAPAVCCVPRTFEEDQVERILSVQVIRSGNAICSQTFTLLNSDFAQILFHCIFLVLSFSPLKLIVL